jgi:Fe-S-cluster containining protein
MKRGRAVPPAELARAAKSYEAAAVLPHCPTCSQPCCKLEQVVLELDWPQAQALYQITTKRRAFEKSLDDGTGPAFVRAAHGMFYAFRSPCPAYDDATKRCGVYGTKTKPSSCDDFPVYQDDGAITADLRCEAVDVDAFTASLRADLGDVDIERSRDERFPFLVTLRVARRSSRGPPDDPPRPVSARGAGGSRRDRRR